MEKSHHQFMHQIPLLQEVKKMTEKEGAIDANLTFYKQLFQILEKGLKILIQVAKEIS